MFEKVICHFLVDCHTLTLDLDPRCLKTEAAMTNGSSLRFLLSAISALPHSLHVSRSHVKQLNRFVPLFWISAALDQQFVSLQRKYGGPMLEGQILRSSPHLSQGRLVRGISLSTSIEMRNVREKQNAVLGYDPYDRT